MVLVSRQSAFSRFRRFSNHGYIMLKSENNASCRLRSCSRKRAKWGSGRGLRIANEHADAGMSGVSVITAGCKEDCRRLTAARSMQLVAQAQAAKATEQNGIALGETTDGWLKLLATIGVPAERRSE
jgi:hypothetical protein